MNFIKRLMEIKEYQLTLETERTTMLRIINRRLMDIETELIKLNKKRK